MVVTKARTGIILLILLLTVALVQPVSSQAEGNLNGEVIETMNSGGYTYALIEEEGKKSWVAVPHTKIGVGDQVEFQPGMEMGNYTSPTLNRSFENIVFSSGVVNLKPKEPEIPASALDVTKAEGANGYTIEEVYAKKADLAGKTVTVRGKVSKVSKFLGLNWVRLKDGSGSRKKGNHKLVATSLEDATKGDIITVSGVVVLDKNVSGLNYDLLIEQATIGK